MKRLHLTLLLILFSISSANILADEYDDEIFPFDTTYDLQEKDEYDDEIFPFDTTYDLEAKDEYDDEIFPFDTTYDLEGKGLIICISFNSVKNVGSGVISKNQDLAFKAALLKCAGPKGVHLKDCKIPKCIWRRK